MKLKFSGFTPPMDGNKWWNFEKEIKTFFNNLLLKPSHYDSIESLFCGVNINNSLLSSKRHHVYTLIPFFFSRTTNFRAAKARENKWCAKKDNFRAVGCAKINSARIAQILNSTEIYYVP